MKKEDEKETLFWIEKVSEVMNMPITPQDYNDDAIKGQQLSKLIGNEIRDRLKGDVPETLAHALCVMAAEIDALKAVLAAHNLGERVADSLDAQTLKVGGEDVTDASNHTATFSQASSRTNLTTGEKLSAMLGKIAKWLADLKTVAFTGSYNDLSNKPTIPAAVTVDQTYNAESQNPQSGVALANHMVRPIILTGAPTGLSHTEIFSSSVPEYFGWTSSNYSINPNVLYIAEFIVQASGYKNTSVNIEVWAKKTTGKTWIGRLSVPLCRGIGYGKIILNRDNGIAFEFSVDIEPNDFSVGDEITIIPSFLVG